MSTPTPRVWPALAALTVMGAAMQTVGGHLTPHVQVVDVLGLRLVDVTAGDWWRLATAPFVSQFGWPHALLNTLAIVLLVRPVERDVGPTMTLLAFVLGSAAAFAGGVHEHGIVWLSAGGSGGVLAVAGLVAADRRRFSRGAVHGALAVGAFTFLPPLLFGWWFELARRGSVGAHLAGLVGGAILGVCTLRLALPRAISAAMVTVFVVATLIPLAPALRPERPTTMGCSDAINSDPTRADVRSRLTFVNDTGRPLVLYWVSYDGRLRYGARLERTRSLGRNRVPTYTHVGAVWAIADTQGSCLVLARARAAPGTVTLSDVRKDSDVCGAELGERLRCPAPSQRRARTDD